MRPTRPALILSVAAALLACRGGSGDDAKASNSAAQNVANACKDVDAARIPDSTAPGPRDGYTTIARRDSLLRVIQAGEQKWRTARPESYTITVVAACFCRDGGVPVVLRVAADSVLDSRDTTGQQSWPDDWRTSLHVAGLFKEARQSACDSTRTTRVIVDPRLGYPSVLSTESRLGMTDTDREYRVLSFAGER
jgi:Family of unknown function (DUF6174)